MSKFSELIKKGIFGLCQMRKLTRFRFKAVALETTAFYSSVPERANWKRKGEATNISSVKLHRAEQKVLESASCHAKVSTMRGMQECLVVREMFCPLAESMDS